MEDLMSLPSTFYRGDYESIETIPRVIKWTIECL